MADAQEESRVERRAKRLAMTRRSDVRDTVGLLLVLAGVAAIGWWVTR